LLIREDDGDILGFISLDHSSMRRSMRKTNGESQLFKYAGCNWVLRIGYC
jgi:hypothetical protein